MSEHVIDTEKLSKTFGQVTAVDSLDIQVAPGAVVGFLGVNGAGKTTTIRMIMGHLHPTSGKVRTLGADPWTDNGEFKQSIAYVSENMNLPGWMTPRYAVKMSERIYPRWDAPLADKLLDEFQLSDAGPYARLSKGRKRRICILLAICQNAELLVMDEPTFGLDVVARHDFLERILDIACAENRTVFLSSHLLSDLERIVDRVVLIDRGRLIIQGDLEQLKSGVRKIYLPKSVEPDDIRRHFNLIRYDRPGPNETVAVVADFDEQRFAALSRQCDAAQTARVFGLNLEDIFVEIVKKTGPEAAKNTEQQHELGTD